MPTKKSKPIKQKSKPSDSDDDEFLNNAIKEVQIETKLIEEENSKKVTKIPKQNNKCMHCKLEHDITLNFPYLHYSPCCHRYSCKPCQKDHNKTSLTCKNCNRIKPNATEIIARCKEGMKENWIGCFILLSEYYFQGVGVEKSHSESFRILNLAANLGSPIAQFQVGTFHKDGLATPKDDVKAAYYWSLASDQGSTEASLQLAKAYQSGCGVEQDHKACVRLLLNSAKNNELAQLELAKYFAGQIPNVTNEMPIDLNEAYKYLETIYNRNNDNNEAMWLLATLLWDGGKDIPVEKKIPVDKKRAVAIFKKVARSGHILALEKLESLSSACNNCKKSCDKSFCSKCYMVKYCSQECQKEDWKKDHKMWCIEVDFKEKNQKISFEFVENAIQHIQAGDFVKAELSLREAKTLDPFSPEVLYWSGQIHQKKQQFPQAIEKFREAIAMAATITNYSVVNIGKYYNLLGLCLALNEQFEEGLQELKTSEKLGNETASNYIKIVLANMAEFNKKE